MSADGKWKTAIDTPVGKQESVFELKADGATLTGTAHQDGQVNEITDGKIDGDTLSWSMKLKRPFPMKLGFTVTIDGDTMTGKVKAGPFGSAKVTGHRAA